MPIPHISICIPAYQAERHLAATVESVLAQDCDGLEVLVLDNASTDATAEILARYSDPRLRTATNSTVLPIADNWNRAVELSRGDLVKVVCADDLIRPDSVRLQAAVLDEDPTVALVGTRRHLIDDRGAVLAADRGLHKMIGRHDGRAIAAQVVRSGGNPLGESAGLMFRRKDFDVTGGFDGRLVFPMDLDLWVRLLAYGDFVGLPETMAAFRASATSLSSERSKHQYLEARELTQRIADDPRWSVGSLDKLIGRLGAPLARLRRELLFRTADLPRPGFLSKTGPGSTTSWLPAAQP